MRLRRLGLAAVAATATMLVPGVAGATPGSVQDPQGDTSNPYIDLRAVYHHEDAATVTYYLQSWNDPTLGDPWRCAIWWAFGGEQEDQPDGEVAWTFEYNPDEESATVSWDGNYDNYATISREPVGAPHAATGSTAANTTKIVVQRDHMRQAGLADGATSYRYLIACGGSELPDWRNNPPHGDVIGKGYSVTHALGGTTPTAPPAPTPAAPAAAPTATEQPTSTSAPTTTATEAASSPPATSTEAPAAVDAVAPTPADVEATGTATGDSVAVAGAGGTSGPVVVAAVIALGLASTAAVVFWRRRRSLP